MFKLSVFTDEVSQDLDKALKVAARFKLDGVEIRSVWGRPPQSLTDEDTDKIRRAVEARDLEVCCIASPFFKCDLDDDAQYRENLDILRRCIKLAQRLGANIIRGFTFWNTGRTEEVWDRILARFVEPVRIIEGEGVFLGIENEASTSVSTARRLDRFLREVNSPRIMAIWDPANEVFADDGERPYPEGYERVGDRVIHCHLKDAVREGGPRCVLVGTGIVDWEGQLRAFMRDKFEGYVSLETHWRPQDLSEDLLNRPGGEAFSEAGEASSSLCLENLLKIVARIRRQEPAS